MPPALLVVAHLPTIGGTPLDDTTNSFAFSVDAIGTTAETDAMATVVDFYTHAVSANSLDQLLGSQLSRASGAALLKVYDISSHLDGSPHGSPVAMSTFTLGAAAADTNLPEGVGCVLTFHADYGADVEFGGIDASIPTSDRAVDQGAAATHIGHDKPRARDRGRIYLGPLNTLMSAEDATTKRISVATARAVQVAAHGNYMRTNPHGTCVWSVWSRRNASLKTVTGGWVDDRFDYQRRREDQGGVRSTFP